MLFGSFQFAVFLVAFLFLYFSIPHRLRWILLLVSSYYFYMCWRPEYVVLIIGSTIADYGLGRLLGRTEHKGSRTLLLLASLCINLGILFTFKYLDFFGDSVRTALSYVNIFADIPHYNLLLPVGISFYTFQSLSYIIDVYRKKTPVENHLGIFAAYVAFFPQLVAGPIERSGHLLPQFKVEHHFNYNLLSSGAYQAVWGLVKKLVIADLVAAVVETVYTNPYDYSGPITLLATFFFAIQIYCDFSGYSDIAIGVARMFGFDIMINFRQPYLSRSFSEFWSRWHISLSTWFRDYVYIPLGGNRVSFPRHYANLLAVFLISGFWHGAAWTFIIWGCLHGLYFVIETILRPARSRVSGRINSSLPSFALAIFQTGLVFVLVMIGWVFFRAGSVPDALYIIKSFTSFDGFNFATLWKLGLPRFEMVAAAVFVGVLFTVDWILLSKPPKIMRLLTKKWFRWTVVFAGIYSIVFFGVFDGIDFIYFQF